MQIILKKGITHSMKANSEKHQKLVDCIMINSNTIDPTALDIFDQHSRIFVKQQKELVKIKIIDWKPANTYTAFTEDQLPVFYIVERKNGLLDAIKSPFWKPWIFPVFNHTGNTQC